MNFIKWPIGAKPNEVMNSFEGKRGIRGLLEATDGSHIPVKATSKGQQITSTVRDFIQQFYRQQLMLIYWQQIYIVVTQVVSMMLVFLEILLFIMKLLETTITSFMAILNWLLILHILS